MALRVLFIGGNGIISSASSARLVERGDDLTLLNRGRNTDRPPIEGARHLLGDADDAASIIAAIGDETFDVVANFRSFSPAQVERDLGLFEGRCGQYVYISSASAYQKPVAHLPITESTPLRNPYWQYSRDKIASEDLLIAAYRERGFPATIIRPSHTYDGTQRAAARRLDRHRPDAARQAGRRAGRRHQPLDAHAHARLRRRVHRPPRQRRAVGEAFHITSDEVLTWNQVGELLARAARRRVPVRCTSRAPRSPASCPRTGPASSATRPTP